MIKLSQDSIIAVIGAGTMGLGIAQVAANAGHKVFLYDNQKTAASNGLQTIASDLAKLIKKGKKTALQVDTLLALITPCDDLQELSSAHLVIEAIVENLAIKQQVLQQVQTLCGSSTILASNTSSLSITSIGTGLKHPEVVVGMHFFNPAPIMKLVEVISGVSTDKSIAKQVYNLASVWGKNPVYASSSPGFIVNRVARPFYAEALRVLQEGGANIATIDTIMRDCGGFKMGPLELTDLIGQDVNYSVTQSVFNAFYQDSRFTPSNIQLELVNAGHLGRKSGQGFYNYSQKEVTHSVLDELTNVSTDIEPKEIIIYGDDKALQAITAQAKNAGITVIEKDCSPQCSNNLTGIQVGKAWLTLTDGRSATQYSAEEAIEDTVFFDLALNYYDTPRIALAKSNQCSDEAFNVVLALFQHINKTVSVIKDLPGMLVMRTVCMLINEGADAVNQQVCSLAAIDVAMMSGVNYPKGPMEWADEIGVINVVNVLDNLATFYGETKYRVSPLLRQHSYDASTLMS